jgi:hypothetical protein
MALLPCRLGAAGSPFTCKAPTHPPPLQSGESLSMPTFPAPPLPPHLPVQLIIYKAAHHGAILGQAGTALIHGGLEAAGARETPGRV